MTLDLSPKEISPLPLGVERTPQGVLTFSGISLKELAAHYGTPLYVLSADVARQRAREILHAFQKVLGPRIYVSYAMKALYIPAFLAALKDLPLHFDAASAGEVLAAQKAGIGPGRLRLHGNNKTDGELRLAAGGGVGEVIVDNLDELSRWLSLSPKEGVRFTLRVAPGISPDTHEYIATGGRGGKFGLDLESGEALLALREAQRGGLPIRGLHAHLGSQIQDPFLYGKALEKLLDLRAAWAGETGRWLEEVNVGGGAAVRYGKENELSPETWAQALADALARRPWREPRPVVGIEPGRAIAAPAGLTLYEVGDGHRVDGFVPVVAVDGGMGDNIRPALYGAHYEAARVEAGTANDEEATHLVGRYCESGDILLREALLPRLRRGDLLAMFLTGAYTHPMAMAYNGIPRAAAVLLEEGRHSLVWRRETEEDLFRFHRMAPWQETS
ncbi:MAG: diaminopimelate decarboxylase [Bacillota bacterium]|nr:diaminopimelate decarboxylase [Bacillota bacterium]